MNKKIWILALWTITVLTGCSPSSESPSASATPAKAAPYAYDVGSLKKGDMALCVVCVVNEGATATEPAVETIDYEGKTYAFCNEEEKAQFISTPAKFAAK
jgi:YHS domain-containing protein